MQKPIMSIKCVNMVALWSHQNALGWVSIVYLLSILYKKLASSGLQHFGEM